MRILINIDLSQFPQLSKMEKDDECGKTDIFSKYDCASELQIETKSNESLEGMVSGGAQHFYLENFIIIYTLDTPGTQRNY